MNSVASNLEYKVIIYKVTISKYRKVTNLFKKPISTRNKERYYNDLNGSKQKTFVMAVSLFALLLALSLPLQPIIPQWTLTVTQADTNKTNWHTQLSHSTLVSFYAVPLLFQRVFFFFQFQVTSFTVSPWLS